MANQPQAFAVCARRHLGLPLVGKTALLQVRVVSANNVRTCRAWLCWGGWHRSAHASPRAQGKIADSCIVCPAHNTAFDLATGAVKVRGAAARWGGEATRHAATRYDEERLLIPLTGTARPRRKTTASMQGKWCPSLPEAVSTGFGLTPPKPLPVYASRVTEAGDIEVDL